MVELGNPKSHEMMMGECDPSKVEALLTAIDNGEDIINWLVFLMASRLCVGDSSQKYVFILSTQFETRSQFCNL